jgi:hypothetical protein
VRDVPVASGENFDYQMTDSAGNKVAVEIFRLVEGGQELTTMAMWEKVVTLLKAELERRQVGGYYMISTPIAFPVKKPQLADFVVGELADQIVAAIGKHSGEQEFNEPGLSFRKGG